MPIKTIPAGPLQTNCYVVSDAGSPEAMIVDPGGDADTIIAYVESEKLDPKVLLNTHAHIDHIGANAEIKNHFPGVQLTVHADDANSLTDPMGNLSAMMGMEYQSPVADLVVQEGDHVTVGGWEFRVLHTPGHTPGGICLYAESPPEGEAPVLIAGDSLFAGSIGRTDFPGGDMSTLLSSIQEKLFVLPQQTTVHSGHGPSTTIGREKESNPFVR